METVALVDRLTDIIADDQDPPSLGGIVRRVERYVAQNGMSTDLRAALIRLRQSFSRKRSPWGRGYLYADDRDALALVDQLLAGSSTDEFALNRSDGWGALAGEALDALDDAHRAPWLALLRYAQTTSGARPARVWLTGARQRIDVLGEAPFSDLIVRWLGFLDPPGRGATSDVLAEANADLLKGLAWSASLIADESIARALADATLACFKKIPNVGARSAKVGNACVYALGAVVGLPGVMQLSRLAQRVKLPSALRLIEAALQASAERNGLTRDDLEELAVPAFDLEDGRIRRELGAYVAEIAVRGAHQVEITWRDAEGKTHRSEPAEVKRSYADQVRSLKRRLADLRATLAAQRDRIERVFLAERSWDLPTWRTRYFDHPLLRVLARGLIWSFDAAGRTELGTWHAGHLVDTNDRPIAELADNTRVHLWHPGDSAPETVLAWRHWLETHEVTQPFKQAHREIYLLTDAERTTETYSNRFAAHILRQHQFQALGQQRGWTYRLQGGWDGWNVPTRVLPRQGLRVELDVEAIVDDDVLTGAGVSLYVTTDRVRFTRLGDGVVIPLVDVPALVFSEAMRDVDLFVGVCSVGNDPTWNAQGPGRFNGYWQHDAFGDLSESAKTRHQVLGRILPRLTKLAGRWELTERFLVVRGDLRTYKIHLGSGNILMAPNDQYLCIVPSRSTANGSGGSLFLPFEGDQTLGVILSKALLLAEDTKITDPSITRQIGTAGRG